MKKNFILSVAVAIILATTLLVAGCSSKSEGSAPTSTMRVTSGTPILRDAGVRSDEDIIGVTEGDISIELPSGFVTEEGDLYEVDNALYYGIAVEDVRSVSEFPEEIGEDDDGVVWLLADMVEVV
ncbi:hypothetical protein IIY24_02930 [Candidatus Saccharibacteria bacterium]|nr:hypothetical protein [Candidatus Saccharibacteria bacterium]